MHGRIGTNVSRYGRVELQDAKEVSKADLRYFATNFHIGEIQFVIINMTISASCNLLRSVRLLANK